MWPWIILIVVIGLGIVLAPLIYAGIEAGSSAQRTKANLTLMRDQLMRGDIDGAQTSIGQAKQELVTIKSSLDRIDRYLRAQLTFTNGVPRAGREHEAILAACEKGDAELASRLTRDHILDAGRSLMTFLREQRA